MIRTKRTKSAEPSPVAPVSAPCVGRRRFVKALVATPVLLAAAPLWGLGTASQIDITQLIYSGGNWQPRPTALRRLAFELQKRTAVNSVLEPSSTKPLVAKLATSPLLYMSGDRSFEAFQPAWIDTLRRYLKLGGTLVIDPSFTQDGDENGFQKSLNTLLNAVFPNLSPEQILPGHVIYRSFYDLNSPAGMRKGSPGLTGYTIGERLAVIVSDHDMGGAWAKDNLGNWENDVDGGARQRENAFRMGINMVMYALCGSYKNEMPHKRFNNTPQGQ